MQILRDQNFDIRSIGLLKGLRALLNRKLNCFYFSSNIKCNIMVMLFNYQNSAIILNGLGRCRRSRMFIRFIGTLLYRYTGTVYVQNYCDYRYYRRYFKKEVEWIPGSGAQKRNVGTSNQFFTVSRNNKIYYQENELSEFIDLFSVQINVVGVTKSLSNDGMLSCGWVSQEEIFKYGNKMVWAAGYGDGLPHSLVDSLYNSLSVYIKRKEFINFGLRHIVTKKEQLPNNWIKIIVTQRNLIDAQTVNVKYSQCITNWASLK